MAVQKVGGLILKPTLGHNDKLLCWLLMNKVELIKALFTLSIYCDCKLLLVINWRNCLWRKHMDEKL